MPLPLPRNLKKKVSKTKENKNLEIPPKIVNNQNEGREKKKKRKILKNSLVTPHDGGRVWDPRLRPDGRRSDVPFLLLNKKSINFNVRHFRE